MSLVPYVRAMGRGPGRARSLTRAEAREAMGLILTGDAPREAVGALLMLMRYRGEVPEEIAGFVEALRDHLPEWEGTRPALDWPSFAAGRTRGVPWFLLSARLVAAAGYPVLLHGWNSHQSALADVRSALPYAGIAQAHSVAEAGALLGQGGIAYLALESYHARALELLRLREVLGLRSAVNTCLRVLNPGGAGAAVQGVFHPSYRKLQVSACGLLGLENMCVIKGGGGEFERHPSKETAVFGLRAGAEFTAPEAGMLEANARRLADPDQKPADLARLWAGDLTDDFARALVVGTAALALQTLGAGSTPEAQALWDGRDRQAEVA